jgi:Domain of unknown function (DUF4189)
MYFRRLLLCTIVLWASITGSVHAQSCPPGYYAASAAGDTGGMSNCMPYSNQEDVPSGPEWRTRWGAVASSADGYGFSTSQPSQRVATKKALAQCKSNSNGQKCKLLQAYNDQCIAMAWGDGGNITASSPSIEEAKANALGLCSQHTSNCQIEYAGCSYPERVQ